jgi:hypothetical protein
VHDVEVEEKEGCSQSKAQTGAKLKSAAGGATARKGSRVVTLTMAARLPNPMTAAIRAMEKFRSLATVSAAYAALKNSAMDSIMKVRDQKM